MDTRQLSVMRVKIIALSRIRQIEADFHRAPFGYRRDTQEYCDAMYDIIDTMSDDRLTDIVTEIYHGYAEVGMADEGYTADSLMTLALAISCFVRVVGRIAQVHEEYNIRCKFSVMKPARGAMDRGESGASAHWGHPADKECCI